MSENESLCKHLSKVKKLVLFLATFLLVSETNKKDYISWKRMLYIYYLFCFWKNTIGVKVLINSDSEVNAMTPAYVSKLGFNVCHTNVGAQKIDGSILKIFGMVLASF